jgi:lysine-N-methylase
MSIPLKLISPAGFQKYDCSGCGDCCRGRFAIIVSEADRERIERQAWTDDDLALGGKPLFTPVGDGYHLAHRDDGACVFLLPDNRCRIHAEHGEMEKPLACRMYPFRLIPLGAQVRVDVRFDCPSVAGNIGRPIAQRKAELQKLLVESTGDKVTGPTEPPPFFGNRVLTWNQLFRVTEVFERVLLDVSLDLTRRIAACVNMAALLRNPKIAAIPEADFSEFVDDFVSDMQSVAANDALKRVPLSGVEGMAFRHLLGVYARVDEVGEKLAKRERVASSLAMIKGAGVVPHLRPGFPAATFAGVDAIRGIPSGDAALAIERYLHVHLSSMSFFGRAFYGRSYLDGLNHLLLLYPMICWFARLYAEGDGTEALAINHVVKALMIVDHQHGVSPIVNVAAHRYLVGVCTERRTLRALSIAYGT